MAHANINDMRHMKVSALTVVVAAALALTACTATNVPSPATPSAVSDPQAVATPARPAALDGPYGSSPGPSTEGCTSYGEFRFTQADNATASTVTMDGRPVDHGPREFAQGEVKTDAEGTPIAYVVAEGDAPLGIQERLCFGFGGIATKNGFPFDQTLRPGDTFDLRLAD